MIIDRNNDRIKLIPDGDGDSDKENKPPSRRSILSFLFKKEKTPENYVRLPSEDDADKSNKEPAIPAHYMHNTNSANQFSDFCTELVV